MSGWDRDDVERWLNKYPLPADMMFGGEKVWPRYQLKKGYGFWLRTAGPYHKALRGLFGLVVEIIQAVPVGKPMPTPEELQILVSNHERAQGTLTFSAEDLAPAAPVNPAIEPGTYTGGGVDFARKLRESGNPATPTTTPDGDNPHF